MSQTKACDEVLARSSQIAVIICCYNSEDRIHMPLLSLAAQNLPSGFIGSIILVDNNSDDNTVKAALQIWEDHGTSQWSLRIVDEPQQGLTSARIRGIRESQAEVCMFLDDDVELAHDFIAKALALLEAYSGVAVVGGAVEPKFEVAAPDWFWKFTGVFTVGSDGPEEKYVRSVAGAAMVFRRRAVLDLFDAGFHFSLSDRQGSQLSGGGDIELCLALQVQHWKLLYSPALGLKHWVPAKRLCQGYACGVAFGMGQSEIFLQPYRLVLAAREGNSLRWLKFKFSWPVQLCARAAQAALSYGGSVVEYAFHGGIPRQRIMAARYCGMVSELCRARFQYSRMFEKILAFAGRFGGCAAPVGGNPQVRSYTTKNVEMQPKTHKLWRDCKHQ